jgi:signal-transduction protein with cAMP-binding, CBS, and nucleotidyltransferase domain
MRIQEVMSHPVISCPVDCTADVPARLMWEFDCGIIPLVDQDGRIAGIVTDRDLCMAALMRGKPLFEIQVNTVMTRDVICCHADDGTETAESQMRDNRIRRVPITDDDRHPVGMFAMNDLARLASGSKRSVVDREVVRTLATVSQPRGNGLHPPDAQPEAQITKPEAQQTKPSAFATHN